MLLLARQAAGQTQKATASQAGISQGKLSRIEAGQHSDIPAGEVEALAKALDVPAAFLRYEGRAYASPISYRRLKGVGARVLKRIEGEANSVRIHLLRLLEHCDIEPMFDLPQCDVDAFGSPKAVAQAVRAAFHLERGPVRDMVEVLENAGVFVVRMPFGHTGVEGLSIHAPGEPPFVFISAHVSSDRQRFVLAHELAHLIMHSNEVRPSAVMEDEADAFAAELLLPESEVRPQLRSGFTLTTLLQLKKYWKVELRTLVYRAGALGLIHKRTERRWWMRLNAFRDGEPDPVPLESPHLVDSLIRTFREELGYSKAAVNEIMLHNGERYLAVYGARLWPRPTLAASSESNRRVGNG